MKKKNQEYQFDFSKPYIIYRNKIWYIIYISFFLFFTYQGLSTGNSAFWGMSSILLILLIMSFRHRNKVIQINNVGITADDIGTITWEQIHHCFYSSGIGKNPEYWLNIKMKDSSLRRVTLNDYSYNSKKLSAAINFYSKRNLFGRTDQDNKAEMKSLLIGFIIMILLSSIIIFCLAIRNGSINL